MRDFEFLTPKDVSDAASMLSADPEARLLSGGMTLLPTMKQGLVAPSALIDLTRVTGLSGIRLEGDRLLIGGCTVHADVAVSGLVKTYCPALAFLAGSIGDPAVRHRGTIGGSVANNDPAADYPCAVLALDAKIITNERRIAADDFFVGLFETALGDGEFVIGFEFGPVKQAGYAKFPNPASRYAMAGVFVARLMDGSVRVAVTGAGSDGVFRWHEAEDALIASWSPSILDGLRMNEASLLSDIHASADYRAALVETMVKRAVTASS